MSNTKAVVIHQFRQIFLYTLYFCGFQAYAFYYDLKAHWTFLAFLILLSISFYEDTTYFDQDSMPESILVLRIWANNVPLITSNMLMYVLERGYFMEVDENKEDYYSSQKDVGRPHQFTINVASTGFEILDDILTAAGYYLFYFTSFAMFRSLIAQFRYVRRLIKDNLNWSSTEDNQSVLEGMSGRGGEGGGRNEEVRLQEVAELADDEHLRL